MTGGSARPESLSSIQILRGIAALSVVFYHVYLIGLDYLHVAVFQSLSEPGKFGVNLFFVLSGFIICFAHEKDLGRPERLPRYVWRRFSRIYPVYWIFSLAYVAAAAAGIGSPDFSADPANLLTSFTLIQLNAQPTLPLKVAWTLLYEMRFYLIFAVLLINRRAGIALLAGWPAYILLANLAGLQDGWNLSTVWNLHFLAGCAVFALRNRLGPSSGLCAISLGLAGIIVAAVGTDFALTPLEGANAGFTALLALASALVVAGCIALERWFRAPSLRALRLLGDASYSLYLVHSGVVSACFIILRKLHALSWLPPVGSYVLVAALATAGGIAAHLLVERPLIAWLRTVTARGLTVSGTAVRAQDGPA